MTWFIVHANVCTEFVIDSCVKKPLCKCDSCSSTDRYAAAAKKVHSCQIYVSRIIST